MVVAFEDELGSPFDYRPWVARDEFLRPHAPAHAIARLEQLLADALFVPKRRIATRPSRGSRERRLAEKRLTADKKAGRGGRHDD